MFFLDNPEYTKHGYYLVDGKIKTFSKLEAWKLSGQDLDKIQFIFNDDVFATFDTTKEPEEDIYELYRQRAEQIRKDYDYVVLIYSGGIDSHTILETFLDNNIHLDEICTFSNNDVESRTSKFNQEVYNSVIPFIETLDLNKLGTKFRLLNIGQTILNQMSDDFHFENFEYYSNILTVWRTAVNSQILKSKILDHRKIAQEGKTVCYIWGYEKPRILIREEKYGFVIPDAFSGGMGAKQYINNHVTTADSNNFYDEAFYICRESPKIAIKQGHMLVNLMSTMAVTDTRLKNPWEIPIYGPYIQATTAPGVDGLWLTKPAADQCIYPRALMSRFGDDKVYGGSTIFSKKDDWFYKSGHENSNKFIQKMNQFVKANSNLILWRPNNAKDSNGKKFPFAVKSVHSKFYPLATVPPPVAK
jgi:hypothetical protein